MRAGLVLLALVLVVPAAAAQAPPTPPPGAKMLHMFGTVFVGPEGTDQVNATPGETLVAMNILIENVTPASHSVTSDDGRSFDVTVPAPDPDVGYAFVTFKAPTTPGNYPFHSKLDAGMRGVLTVVGAAKSPGVQLIAVLASIAGVSVACAPRRSPPRR